MIARLPLAQRPRLETKRLALRELRASDAAQLLAMHEDAPDEPFRDPSEIRALEEAEAWIAKQIERAARGELIVWAVADRATDDLLGVAGLHAISREHARAQVAYELSARHWGKGLMTEAMSAIVDFAFTKLLLHRLAAEVDPGNVRSVRMLERLGFVCEGLLRESYFARGAFRPTALYGLLRREWCG